MKHVIIIFLLLTATAFAQTVYEIVPGTNGNEIVLSIANESKTETAEKITVALSNNPRGIELCGNLVSISKLKPNDEREANFSFDAKRIPGTQRDTLKFLITDNKGGSWKKEIVIEYALPKEFKLEQNYPNPFNPSTTIEFTIPQNGRYNLSVYNTLGQFVKLLSEDEYIAGYYKVSFDAGKLASGMYIYRLSGSNVNILKKMMLVK
jgi:hypothetical protein